MSSDPSATNDPAPRRRLPVILTALAATAIAVALNCPYRFTPTSPDITPDSGLLRAWFLRTSRPLYEQRAGFPWLFLRREVNRSKVRTTWSAAVLAANVGVGVTGVVLLTSLLVWRQRRRRRWFHVSLSDVLMLMLLVAAPCIYWQQLAIQLARERKIVAGIRNCAHYQRRLPFPDWLYRILPERLRNALSEVHRISWQPDRYDAAEWDRASRLHRLRELALQGSGVNEQCLQRVGQLKQLESLVVQSPTLTDPGLVPLAQLTRLHSLSLAVSQLTHKTLQRLGALQRLKTLRVAEVTVNPQGIQAIAALRNLERLALPTIQGSSLRELSGHPRLQQLIIGDEQLNLLRSVSFNRFAAQQLSVDLRDLPRLRRIDFAQGFRPRLRLTRVRLENLPQLERFNTLIGAQMLDVVPTRLPPREYLFHKLPRLKTLIVPLAAGDQISIRETRAIESLYLGWPLNRGFLTTLPVDRNQFTQPVPSPELMQAIGGMRQLRRLDLNHLRVRDEHMAEIAKLTELRALYLCGTDITEDGLRRIKRLRHLTELHLGDSQVRVIDDDQFDASRGLSWLDLTRLEVPRIRISHLPELTRLAVGGSALVELTLEELPALKKVESLGKIARIVRRGTAAAPLVIIPANKRPPVPPVFRQHPYGVPILPTQ